MSITRLHLTAPRSIVNAADSEPQGARRQRQMGKRSDPSLRLAAG